MQKHTRQKELMLERRSKRHVEVANQTATSTKVVLILRNFAPVVWSEATVLQRAVVLP